MVVFDKIHDFYREIKFFFQRGIKGYCDKDLWSIDYWFIKTIIPMLEEFNEIKHGVPIDMEEEEWTMEIKNMIYCFKESTDEYCSEKNEYEEDFHNLIWRDYAMPNKYKDEEELRQKWIDREYEIDKYKEKMRNKGFELFSKYYDNLWD